MRNLESVKQLGNNNKIAKLMRLAMLMIMVQLSVNTSEASETNQLSKSSEQDIENSFKLIQEKMESLKTASFEGYLLQDVLTKYWQAERSDFKGFDNEFKKLRYSPLYNHSRGASQMVNSMDIEVKRLFELYPEAREELVNKYGYPPIEKFTCDEDTYRNLPEEHLSIWSSWHVFEIGSFGNIGDHIPKGVTGEERQAYIDQDEFETASRILGQDEFMTRHLLSINENGKTVEYVVTLNPDGIQSIERTDGLKPSDDLIASVNSVIDNQKQILMAKKNGNIKKYTPLSKKDASLSENNENSIDKDYTKYTFLNTLKESGFNFRNSKEEKKIIAQVLSKDTLNDAIAYGENKFPMNKEAIRAITKMYLTYRKDATLGGNGDDPPDTGVLFSTMLSARKDIFNSVPNQYGLKSRIEELKKAQNEDDIHEIVEKIVTRKGNENLDRSELFTLCLTYMRAHHVWYFVRFEGEKAPNPFLQQVAETRDEISSVVKS